MQKADPDDIAAVIDLIETNGPLYSFDALCAEVGKMVDVPAAAIEDAISIWKLHTKTPRKHQPHVVSEYVVNINNTIYVPSGKCPVKLKGSHIWEVCDWVKNLQKHYFDEKKYITHNAVLFFAKQFYNYDHPEYNKVIQHIEDFYRQ